MRNLSTIVLGVCLLASTTATSASVTSTMPIASKLPILSIFQDGQSLGENPLESYASWTVAKNVVKEYNAKKAKASDAMDNILKENNSEKKENDKDKSKNKNRSLTDEEIEHILKSLKYVPISEKDEELGGLRLNKKAPSKVTFGEKKTQKGPFVTYGDKANSYTVYVGDSSSRKEAYPGITYEAQTGHVVQIHVTSANYETPRGVKVGSERGRVILKYGAPHAIWQDLQNESLIYIYPLPKQKNGKEDGLLAFTIKDFKVASIDLFAEAARNDANWPALKMRTFKKDQLVDDDFVLEGYRINDPFSLKKGTDREWDLAGTLWGKQYVVSDYGAVLYDNDNQIAKVILGHGTSVTRRGIGVGSNKLLLLYTYGAPTKIYKKFSFAHNEDSEAYEYKNPYAVSEYLIFVIDKKTKFIDAVMLSDRPVNLIRPINREKDSKKYVDFLLYNELPM